MSPEDVLEIQLVTNALREDVPAVEQARSWRRLMDAKGLSHRELAEQLGYDHATVTRALGLLNLPESIQAQVDAGEIRPQTGYELSRIDDAEEQAHLAEEAKAGRLKRDDLRRRVKESKPARAGGAKGRGAQSQARQTTVRADRQARRRVQGDRLGPQGLRSPRVGRGPPVRTRAGRGEGPRSGRDRRGLNGDYGEIDVNHSLGYSSTTG